MAHGHARLLFVAPLRRGDSAKLVGAVQHHRDLADPLLAGDDGRGELRRYVTPVPAVHPCGRMLALGASTRRPAPRRVDHQAVIGDYDLPHHEVQTREENIFERLHLHNIV